MRREMKQKIHAGHLGVNSCIRRAKDVIYWPGMSAEVRQYVETCGTCSTYAARQPEESPVVTEVPKRPWKKAGADLFTYGGKYYCILVDYHSDFFEVDLLPNTLSESVTDKFSSHFARYGAPVELVSDNGPQFACRAFKAFMQEWNACATHYEQPLSSQRQQYC